MGSKHTAARRLIKGKYFDGLKSINQFVTRSRNMPTNKMRGDYLEVLVEAILYTHHKFQAKRVCLVGDIDADMVKALDLIDHHSAGIDGAFEDHQGRMFPYQVKNYSKKVLNLEDLGTVKWGSGNGGALTYIFSTAEKLNDLVRKDKKVRGIMLDFFETLTADDFRRVCEWVKSDDFTEFLDAHTLRPGDQIPCQKAIDRGFKANDRVQIHNACGTGKSVIAAEYSRLIINRSLRCAVKNANNRSLRKYGKPAVIALFVPTISLVDQTLGDFKRQLGALSRYLVVASDDKIGRDSGECFMSLADASFPATTNVIEIRAAIDENSSKPLIIVSTYKSQLQVGRALKGSKHEMLDLMICDEAHNTTNRASSYCLYNKYIPARKRLFMTASPRFYNSVGGGRIVASMDDESLYGPVVYTISTKEANDLGLTVKVRPVLSFINNQTIDEDMLRYGKTEIEKNQMIEECGVDWALAQVTHLRSIIKFNVEYSIMFLSRKTRVRMMAEHPVFGIGNVEVKGGVEAFYITGDLNAEKRRQVLKRMRSSKAKYKVLIADRALNEGFNFREVGLVHFTNPKYSIVAITQCSGRGCRNFEDKAKGKKKTRAFALIDAHVLPGESINDALKRSNMDILYNTIIALMNTDEILATRVNELVVGEKGGPRIGGNDDDDVIVDAPNMDYDEVIDSVRVAIMDRCVDDWSKTFKSYVDFIKVEGREPTLASGNTKSEKALSMWAIDQCRRNKDGTLSSHRKTELERIGFVWSRTDLKWSQLANKWLSLRKKLGRELYGNSSNAEERILASWVNRQRTDYQLKTLREDRIEFLNDNKFVWDRQRAMWEDKFNQWLDYKNSKSKDDNGLEVWMKNQRSLNRLDKLDSERKSILKSHGFTFNTAEAKVDRLESMWLTNLDKCEAVYKKTGKCPPPSKGSVGRWLSNQRQSFKKKTLPRKRLILLNKRIPVWEKVAIGGYRENSGRKASKA